jgi:5-methylcytosine-specific restriction endonuclease McrA
MPHINLGRRKPRDRTINKGLYQDIYQDKRWKTIRQAKFEENPLCELCEAAGRVTQTEEVHHKRPFQTGTTPEEIEILAFDWDNLQSLCTPCHKEEDKKIREGTRVKLIFSQKSHTESGVPLSFSNIK